MVDKKKLKIIAGELRKASAMHKAQAKKIDSMSKGPSMINIAGAVAGLNNQKQSTAVGSIAPHSHDSSKDNAQQIPPIAPPQPDNITGNLNNNLKVQQLGANLFEGEALAGQEMDKRNLGKPVMPPSLDPMGDQYGSMFNSPFAQTNNYKYKKGDLIDETDHEESTYRSSNEGVISGKKYNVENISKIQEDDKGQFMTTLGEGEYFGGPRPTSSRVTNYDQGRNAVRDTLRPAKGKVFISTWKKNK